jgi:hypothetical protein
LLIALGVWLALTRRAAAGPSNVQSKVDRFTTRTFVVAVGLAVLGLSVFPIADFTETFVQNYEPAVVFLEDVILAAFVLAVVGRIQAAPLWSVQSIAIAAALVLVASYWVCYQARLAMRFPPREIGVASVLRSNVALTGADFIAPELPQIVWYYTRGRALSLDSPPVAAPVFLVCESFPSGPTAARQCDSWRTLLKGRVGDTATLGRTLVQTADYQIDALPPCSTAALPAEAAYSACGPSASAPPILRPIAAALDSPRVGLTISLETTTSLAHVVYRYVQEAGSPEAGSVVRLYVLQPTGTWCLINESAGTPDVRFPLVSAGQFRAAVIPRSESAIGLAYFSDPQELDRSYIFDLPDTLNGGVQHIAAHTLEEAEQQAVAAGTWSPGAGTLGQDARTAEVDSPTADRLCSNPAA